MLRKSHLILSIFIALALMLTIGNLVYPDATRTILNILWFISLSVAIMFIAMGIMAVLGLKKEVSKLMEMFMEGSFSVMDFIDLVKQVIKLFIARLKEILLNLAPFFSYVLAVSLYLGILYLYKSVGKDYDVTLLTIVLSVAGTGVLSYTNMPNQGVEEIGWRHEFGRRIRKSFVDSFEVVLFVFFLTMDSTHLFYIPADLNVPIRSQVGNYDLMLRGFHLDSVKTTLIIIAAAIVVEVVRNILKIIYSSKKYYDTWLETEPQSNSTERQRYQNIKKAVRLSFAESKDDLVRFVSFTTVLIIVFITFPRLKLLAMMTVSVTLLIFDLIFPVRLLTTTRNRDLISKVLEKTLKI